VNPASNLLYTARLCPINKFIQAMAVRQGPIWERFDRFTFAVESKHPERVVVDRGHAERELGRLRKLYVENGWWMCKFRMNHTVGDHFASVGTPVSIAFVPLRSRDGYHELARLEEVSLVDRAGIEGAEVTAVYDLSTDPWEESFAMAPELAAALRSNGIDVREPRPEPAPVSDERDRFVADPWLVAAQVQAAKRGTIIRQCGRVLGVS
jgi:hypothetical protein